MANGVSRILWRMPNSGRLETETKPWLPERSLLPKALSETLAHVRSFSNLYLPGSLIIARTDLVLMKRESLARNIDSPPMVDRTTGGVYSPGPGVATVRLAMRTSSARSSRICRGVRVSRGVLLLRGVLRGVLRGLLLRGVLLPRPFFFLRVAGSGDGSRDGPPRRCRGGASNRDGDGPPRLRSGGMSSRDGSSRSCSVIAKRDCFAAWRVEPSLTLPSLFGSNAAARVWAAKVLWAAG